MVNLRLLDIVESDGEVSKSQIPCKCEKCKAMYSDRGVVIMQYIALWIKQKCSDLMAILL